MAGEEVPAENPVVSFSKQNPGLVPNPQPAAPLPRAMGEDAARIFVDSDDNSLTGYCVGGIGADRMLEITGKGGIIISRTVSDFAGATAASWNWTQVGILDAAMDAAQLECGLDLANGNGLKVVFWTTDWRGAKDTVDAYATGGTRNSGTGPGYYNRIAQDGTMMMTSSITPEQLQKMKQFVGVGQPGIDYNEIVEGMGTGLAPPTEEGWDDIASEGYVVEDVAPMGGSSLNASKDNSKSKYFPPIGSQGVEGSCVCWATGYYTKTFQEAKEHDWNVSAATWSGGHYGAPSASYQDHIMSPDFLYHQINNGVDSGSYYSSAMDVCNR
ncbi:MAG TPA: hypothetical protein VMC61_06580, partial [Methanocella sp.]|nr:hypothetical protein [Methanocella sp.]